MSPSVRYNTSAPSPYVLGFHDIGHDDLHVVGGKAQNLGLLSKALGTVVPPGFCVTTTAFRAFVADDPVYDRLMDELADLITDDLAVVRDLGARLRTHLHGKPLPTPVAEAVVHAWRTLGTQQSYAVRSSATAEDLPTASFAGQQDTYLEVRGRDDLLARVRDCFASLYSDRAIAYRTEKKVPHAQVTLCAVVQAMVRSDKSGILFTADPITGHRGVMAIDAGFGLGESLVSGLVSADLYKVDKHTGRLASAVIGDKKLAIRAAGDPDSSERGGTVTIELSEEERKARVLDDGEIATLARMGQRIENLYGSPQDIEWCMENGALHVVQARPITALYPIPRPIERSWPSDPSILRAYACFNHFQVMTDAMPPMSTSLWQLMVPLGRDPGDVRYSPDTADAGGRLFIDLSPLLRQPVSRRLIYMEFRPWCACPTRPHASPPACVSASTATWATSRSSLLMMANSRHHEELMAHSIA